MQAPMQKEFPDPDGEQGALFQIIKKTSKSLNVKSKKKPHLFTMGLS